MTEGNQHLRVGHADRDRVIAELRRAASDGKLTPDELAERCERTQVARTVGDLAAILGDLQPPRAPLDGVEPYRGAPPALRPPGPPGYSPEDPLLLNAGFTGTKRTGRWEVPPFLRAQALADTVRLDCLEATTQAQVIDLEVLPGAATVVVVVPEGWAVDAARLGKTFGSVTSKVPAQPSWGNPVIVVRGSIGIGSFKARGANWLDRRRLGHDR